MPLAHHTANATAKLPPPSCHRHRAATKLPPPPPQPPRCRSTKLLPPPPPTRGRQAAATTINIVQRRPQIICNEIILDSLWRFMAAVAADGQADSQDTDGASNLSLQLQRFGWWLKTTAAVEEERRRRCGYSRGCLYRTMGSIFDEIGPTVAELWASASAAWVKADSHHVALRDFSLFTSRSTWTPQEEKRRIVRNIQLFKTVPIETNV